MKHLFTRTCVEQTAPSLGLLVVRLIAGLAMMMHGWGKIQSPMSWMGPDSPVPGFLQFLAAISEFGGGLAWIIGLLVPFASLGIFFTMTVAVYIHAIIKGDPFVGQGGSYELASIFWAISVLMMTAGAGKFSIDGRFCKRG